MHGRNVAAMHDKTLTCSHRWCSGSRMKQQLNDTIGLTTDNLKVCLLRGGCYRFENHINSLSGQASAG